MLSVDGGETRRGLFPENCAPSAFCFVGCSVAAAPKRKRRLLWAPSIARPPRGQWEEAGRRANIGERLTVHGIHAVGSSVTHETIRGLRNICVKQRNSKPAATQSVGSE
jgi:hypothetical protein